MMRKQSKRNKPRRQGAQGGRQLIPHPPPIQSFGITHSTKLRFVTNAAVAQTLISFQNLLDTLNFAATAITAFQIFDRVRIKSVELWSVPVIGNATSVQVEFVGTVAGVTGDSRIHTDTSMGIEPAHVKARPAARSGGALFQGTAGGNAFVLTCPSGTVVDVDLAFRGAPGVANPTGAVPAGAVAGAWYYRGLDGLAIAATVFVPVINASGAD